MLIMNSLSCNGLEDIEANDINCDNVIINNSLNVGNILNELHNIITYDSSANIIYFYASNDNDEILFHTYLSNYLYNSFITVSKYLTKIDKYGKINVFHQQDVTLPTRGEGWWVIHDELVSLQRDAIGLRFDVTNLQASSSLQGGYITSQGISIGNLQSGLIATTTIASSALTLATTLAITKNNIITWTDPFLYNNDTLYLKYHNSLSLDTSGNIKVTNPSQWTTTSGTLIYFNNTIGIGLNNPNTSYKLDVLGNINCQEIYRSGVPITSTLSLFLPLTGGLLTGILTGTNINANYFSGNGQNISNINASNITSGTLSITQGGSQWTTIGADIYYLSGKVGIINSLTVSGNIICPTLNALQNLQENGINLTSKYLQLTGGQLYGGLTINTSTTSQPTIGTFGGIGDRIILNVGSLSMYPSSLGINTKNMWYSTPSSSTHSFYIGGQEKMRLDTSGNLNSIYFTGNGNNITNINASNITTGKLLIPYGGSQWSSTLSGTIYYNKSVGINKSPHPNYGLDVSGYINCNEVYKNNVPIDTTYMKIIQTVRKSGFNFQCSTALTLENGTYYKYDIDLRLYTNTYTFSSTPIRKFKIMTWMTSAYFDAAYSNRQSDQCIYEISSSYEAFAGTSGGRIGYNICAIGYPENYNLNQDMGGQFLLRNNFDYLTYCSPVLNTSVSCLIIDYL